MYNSIDDKKCIAILGGTFNPVHKGHIMMAEETKRQFPRIEKVVLMPNNKTAYKDNYAITDSEHRLNMLKLSVDESAYKDYLEISELELRRGGITYTIDTLREIRESHKELEIFFIIGADSFYSFEKWKDYNEILKLCTLIVFRRDNDDKGFFEYSNDFCNRNNCKVLHAEASWMDVSSSKIRRLVHEGKEIDDLVSKSVSEYIALNKLYV